MEEDSQVEAETQDLSAITKDEDDDSTKSSSNNKKPEESVKDNTSSNNDNKSDGKSTDSAPSNSPASVEANEQVSGKEEDAPVNVVDDEKETVEKDDTTKASLESDNFSKNNNNNNNETEDSTGDNKKEDEGDNNKDDNGPGKEPTDTTTTTTTPMMIPMKKSTVSSRGPAASKEEALAMITKLSQTESENTTRVKAIIQEATSAAAAAGAETVPMATVADLTNRLRDRTVKPAVDTATTTTSDTAPAQEPSNANNNTTSDNDTSSQQPPPQQQKVITDRNRFVSTLPTLIPMDQWDEYYQKLVDYYQQHYTTNINMETCPYEHRQLAMWTTQQRTEKYKMSAAQIEKLDALHFRWHKKSINDQRWDAMYQKLLKFHKANGHTRVPIRWPQDPSLGKWVSRQRETQTNLPPERRDKLNALKFNWRLKPAAAPLIPNHGKYDHLWAYNFQLLLQFKEKHGHFQVPLKYQEDTTRLGKWWDKQLALQRRGEMKPDRQESLLAIGVPLRNPENLRQLENPHQHHMIQFDDDKSIEEIRQMEWERQHEKREVQKLRHKRKSSNASSSGGGGGNNDNGTTKEDTETGSNDNAKSNTLPAPRVADRSGLAAVTPSPGGNHLARPPDNDTPTQPVPTQVQHSPEMQPTRQSKRQKIRKEQQQQLEEQKQQREHQEEEEEDGDDEEDDVPRQYLENLQKERQPMNTTVTDGVTVSVPQPPSFDRGTSKGSRGSRGSSINDGLPGFGMTASLLALESIQEMALTGRMGQAEKMLEGVVGSSPLKNKKNKNKSKDSENPVALFEKSLKAVSVLRAVKEGSGTDTEEDVTESIEAFKTLRRAGFTTTAAAAAALEDDSDEEAEEEQQMGDLPGNNNMAIGQHSPTMNQGNNMGFPTPNVVFNQNSFAVNMGNFVSQPETIDLTVANQNVVTPANTHFAMGAGQFNQGVAGSSNQASSSPRRNTQTSPQPSFQSRTTENIYTQRNNLGISPYRFTTTLNNGNSSGDSQQQRASVSYQQQDITPVVANKRRSYTSVMDMERAHQHQKQMRTQRLETKLEKPKSFHGTRHSRNYYNENNTNKRMDLTGKWKESVHRAKLERQRKHRLEGKKTVQWFKVIGNQLSSSPYGDETVSFAKACRLRFDKDYKAKRGKQHWTLVRN